MTKSVVVTGASGFIGSYFVKSLQAQWRSRYRIVALDRSKPKEEIHGVTYISHVDIYDTPELVRLFDEAEIGFHFAALPRV